MKSIFCNISLSLSLSSEKWNLERPFVSHVCEFDKKDERGRGRMEPISSSLNLGAKTIIQASICELKRGFHVWIHSTSGLDLTVFFDMLGHLYILTPVIVDVVLEGLLKGQAPLFRRESGKVSPVILLEDLKGMQSSPSTPKRLSFGRISCLQGVQQI